MKHLLIIFSLLLTSVSWSKDVDWNDLVERDGLIYEKFSDKPFTGKSTGMQQGKIKKGLRNGEWFIFWDNGQLSFKVTFKNGKKIGKEFSYRPDGVLHSTYIYKDGKLIETIKP